MKKLLLTEYYLVLKKDSVSREYLDKALNNLEFDIKWLKINQFLEPLLLLCIAGININAAVNTHWSVLRGVFIGALLAVATLIYFVRGDKLGYLNGLTALTIAAKESKEELEETFKQLTSN